MCNRPAHTGGDAITEPYPGPNGYPDAESYPYTNPNPFTLSDAIAHSVTHPDPAYPYSGTDARPHGDADADADTNPGTKRRGFRRHAERRHAG